MTPSRKWLLTALLCLLAVTQSPAAGPYDDLLKWIPDQANTLLLMDIYELHKSPLGKQEDWAKKHTRTSLGRSEERRVGKECRARRGRYRRKKKKENTIM